MARSRARRGRSSAAQRASRAGSAIASKISCRSFRPESALRVGRRAPHHGARSTASQALRSARSYSARASCTRSATTTRSPSGTRSTPRACRPCACSAATIGTACACAWTSTALFAAGSRARSAWMRARERACLGERGRRKSLRMIGSGLRRCGCGGARGDARAVSDGPGTQVIVGREHLREHLVGESDERLGSAEVAPQAQRVRRTVPIPCARALRNKPTSASRKR